MKADVDGPIIPPLKLEYVDGEVVYYDDVEKAVAALNAGVEAGRSPLLFEHVEQAIDGSGRLFAGRRIMCDGTRAPHLW